MRLLLETHPAFADHDAGPDHPERPERLDAVPEGVERLDLGDDVVFCAARPPAVGALVGLDRRPEPPTSGGPAMDGVEAAAELRSSS
ncbi:MAG TPA: hypothetical protein VG078_10995 [Acidimicrobiales bacterium]|nr:hypothetical protein [Acidimicrobiales bacterium]